MVRSGTVAASPESLGEERQGAGSRQGFFALLMQERGRGPCIARASVMASSSLLSSSPENQEPQRRSHAAAVVPTKRCERADPANSSDDATAGHGVDEQEAWPPAGLEPRVAPQHIADTSGRSRYGEALDRPHRREPHRSEHDGLSRNLGRWRQETADSTDAARPISFGP